MEPQFCALVVIYSVTALWRQALSAKMRSKFGESTFSNAAPAPSMPMMNTCSYSPNPYRAASAANAGTAQKRMSRPARVRESSFFMDISPFDVSFGLCLLRQRSRFFGYTDSRSRRGKAAQAGGRFASCGLIPFRAARYPPQTVSCPQCRFPPLWKPPYRAFHSRFGSGCGRIWRQIFYP